MLAGSKFHSCGEGTEKPLLPYRSFRYRGTRSPGAEPLTTTEGCALLECQTRRGVYIVVLLPSAALSRGIIKLYLLTNLHSSIKYSGARPARQLLVMELSLYRIHNGTGSL